MAIAQDTNESELENDRIEQLESEIKSLRSKAEEVSNRLSDRATEGSVAFLGGAICALWAKNSGRNAWIWFFWGAVLMPITILIMLYKNAQDVDQSSST